MNDRDKVNQAIAKAWRTAWTDRRFRIKTVIGSIFLFCVLVYLPVFFGSIEQRQGAILNDRLLYYLPAVDFSIPMFIIIWSMTLLILYRCAQDPSLFILFLFSFILLSFSRMITILIFPLEPPVSLIPLKDPLIGIFYGGTEVFIKKDLFYSGHTSVQFLIFLCVKKKNDKIISLLATIIVGILVLIQHIHFTIDVIAAAVIPYFIYRLGKWLAEY